MLKSWYHYFKELIINRVIEIDDMILKDHPESKVLENQCIMIFQKLLAILPPEQRSLIFDYESIQASLMNLSSEIIYRQGFIDGIQFGNFMEQIKQEMNQH